MRLPGARALVTGASRGIGRAIALELAREGADVAILYRKEKDQAVEVADAVARLGRRASIHQADVSSWEQVEAAVAEAAAEGGGGLDVVVANAGIAAKYQAVADTDAADWRRVLGVDLDGAFYTAKAALPYLGSAGRESVIFISSAGADTCNPYGAPYYVSKAGVNALVRVLAKELAAQGVTVNAVASGLVEDTDLGHRLVTFAGRENLFSQIPLGRAATLPEVARMVAYLASEDARYITGQVIRVDGGASA